MSTKDSRPDDERLLLRMWGLEHSDDQRVLGVDRQAGRILERLAELERSYDAEAPGPEGLPPVSPEEHRAMAMRVRASLRARAAESEPSGQDDEWDGDPQEERAETRHTAVDELAERRERRPGWSMAAIAVVVAVAAALVVWLVPRGGDESSLDGTSIAVLPSYRLAVLNETVHEMRSASGDEDVDRYQLDSEVWWMIRPERPVTHPVAVRIVAEQEGEAPRVLEPAAVRVSPEGIFELRGELRSILPVEPGRWTMRFVIGAPDALPRDVAGLSAEGPWTIVGDPYVLEILPAHGSSSTR